MKILIIGCGSIGTVIANAAGRMTEVAEILLFDSNEHKAERLSETVSKAKSIGRPDLDDIDINLLIEAASQQAAKQYIADTLRNGKDAMIMSVGAFADEVFQSDCFSAVREKSSSLIIPSGAIAGIDALKAAGIADLKEVRLTTIKPPKGLAGVKFLQDQGIKVEELSEKRTLYTGPADEAVRLFPANVNVAASVSLAGIGFKRTEVEIVCDPDAEVNTHQLFARGEFGELKTITKNLPSPDNPRTSYLASLSAISALRSYTTKIWIGI